METPKLGLKGRSLWEGKRNEKRVMLDGAALRRESRWALEAQAEACALAGRTT